MFSSKKPKFIKLSNLELIVFDIVDILYNPEKDILYPYVFDILKDLKQIGYKLAIITYNINCIFILERFKLLRFFDYIEIEDYWKKYWEYKLNNLDISEDKIHLQISNYKTQMFKNLLEKSNINPSKILNFDTEHKFIYATSVCGIFSIIINKQGINEKIINNGFTNFLSEYEWYVNPNYSIWYKII